MNHPTSPYLIEIKTLRARNEVLEAECAYWKGQVLPADADVRAIRAAYPAITTKEAISLVVLSNGRCVSHETLSAAVRTSEEAASNIVSVYLTRIRRKLPWLRIKNTFGLGWQLDAQSLTAIRNAMQGKAA